jgi:uncharacterized protein
MKADLTDAEFDELARLLDATPAPLQPLDLPMLDGYLAGVLVQPRLVPQQEWLGPVFDFERRALPPASDTRWLERTVELIERRRSVINAGIGEQGLFDPVVLDAEQLPPASEYDAVTSPISRALLPWAAGFQWAQECFPDLHAMAADDSAAAAALARIYRHLPAQDDAERALRASLEGMAPLTDLDLAIDDLVAATVELWDLSAEPRYAVATVRRDSPKVGRNDPCPCGSGRKFKTCHGR